MNYINQFIKVILLLILLQCVSEKESEVVPSYVLAGEKHLRNIIKLTQGGENAEAYFSFNEKMLIFQATVQGMSCDQQFIMDLDGKNKKLVSTGYGRTTCGYFLPGDTTVIYSSTHHENTNCPPQPDMSRGYVWKLYDSYDIFLTGIDGTVKKRLTDSSKYDAEATVSPVGDKIIFTSLRDGDPEIYSMNLDGTDQTRLTFVKGYDGGPFFSWDGKKIVFRASRPNSPEESKDYIDLVENGLVRPTILEIFVMNSDGTDMQQVTNYKKASFAPFFHPDGKRIIFSSNATSENVRNFDLYIINIDGTGFERVTFNETFDGFPMFTHDGKHLVFASNRFGAKEGDTNIFLAEWVD